jgi:hypothetical protein
MKKLIVLLFLVTPAFASFHYVGRTLEPTAKVVSYPVRHPVKTSKGVAKGTVAVVKAVF